MCVIVIQMGSVCVIPCYKDKTQETQKNVLIRMFCVGKIERVCCWNKLVRILVVIEKFHLQVPWNADEHYGV